MSRTLRLALLALACTVDLSQASGFTGEGSRGESGEGTSRRGSQKDSACWDPGWPASIFFEKGILSWPATRSVPIATDYGGTLSRLSQ